MKFDDQDSLFFFFDDEDEEPAQNLTTQFEKINYKQLFNGNHGDDPTPAVTIQASCQSN